MKRLSASAVCLLLATAAHAGVTVKDAWVRATAPGQTSAAAYVTLESSADAKVVGASSPAARSAGLHTTANASGVMHMDELEALKLPAHRIVEMKPGADHIMLMQLAKPLKPGEEVPLVLTIEDARGRRSTLDVKARVTPLTE